VQFDDRFTDKNTFVYDCLGSSEPEKNQNIWLCVSCHKCEEMCPYDVSPLRFIKSLKAQAFEFGYTPDMIRGELENVLLTGYAFPIMPSTARWRKELGLEEINTSASRDIKIIAEITDFIKKMKGSKESKS
jgi:heterodisulfide reductase subunit C